MSFHETAQNIRIEDGHRLFADLQTESGDWVSAEMDLNTVLGNNDGTCPLHSAYLHPHFLPSIH